MTIIRKKRTEENRYIFDVLVVVAVASNSLAEEGRSLAECTAVRILADN